MCALDSTRTLSISSSVRMTNCALPTGYPFTISFDSTGTLSTGHMYGRFSGERHVACRVVKEMSFVSVAVYSFTGMFTRPNEMLPLQIARAAGMEVPAFGRRVRAAVYRLRLFYKGTRKVKAREVRTSRPRRDLDRLRRARGLARHAVDAVALPDRF